MLKHNIVDARNALKYTLIGLGSLVAFLHLLSLALHVNLPSVQTYQIATWFDLDSERNIPTVYSGLILGCCALLCLFLSAQKSRSHEKLRWILLALLFLYLAFDEILVIHELFAEPIRDLLSIAGDSPLFHAWVIPGMMIAAGIGLLAFFIRHHSETSRLQRSIFTYIAILAVGVILLEILGTRFYFSTTFYKAGPVFIEEMFEIIMSSLILYKLSSAINFKIPVR